MSENLHVEKRQSDSEATREKPREITIEHLLKYVVRPEPVANDPSSHEQS